MIKSDEIQKITNGIIKRYPDALELPEDKLLIFLASLIYEEGRREGKKDVLSAKK